MFSFQWKWWKRLAVLWLLFITLLFLLPGYDIPREDWLDKIYADKWVHAGFFAVLIFLWRFYISSQKKAWWLLLTAAFCYAIFIEIVQALWVANRSADLWDIVADIAGAIAGLVIWQKAYKKNKPL